MKSEYLFDVAQICNLLYRGIAFRRSSTSSKALELAHTEYTDRTDKTTSASVKSVVKKPPPKISTYALRAFLLLSLTLLAQAATTPSPRVRPLTLPESRFKSGAMTLQAFAPAAAAARDSIVELIQNEKTVSLGTIIDANGLVLTKASEIKDGKLTARFSDGREVESTVLGVDEENDLALVKVTAAGLKPIEWAPGDVAVGQWAVTPGIGITPESAGIISVPVRKLHKRAYIGVSLSFDTAKAVIGRITKGLGAERAGLKAGDAIVSVNGEPIKDSEELMSALRQFREGETVKLRVRRGEEEFDADVPMMAEPPPFVGVQLESESSAAAVRSVTPGSGAERAGLRSGDLILSLNDDPAEDRAGLMEMLGQITPGDFVKLLVKREEKKIEIRVKIMPESPGQPRRTGRGRGGLNRQERMNRMGGELSQRADGFDLAIQHDTILQPWQCGGPLVNLDGEAIGLNIARAGRVASYALPAALVKQIVEAWVSP
ncbi:MAG: PDZ domain-containing protein [Verrucomicrobia bacterium]|nr:PDZ domain-containing protein [Verrucomicrobiota bacterium]